MPQARYHTMARRLRLLALIATSIHPVGREDLIHDLGLDMFGSQEPATIERTFYVDMRWLREELGADIVYRHQQHGYELLSVPDELRQFGQLLSEWRPRYY